MSYFPAHLRTDRFFLMVDDYTHRIYQFSSPDLDDLSTLKFPPEDRPIAVDFDFKEQRLYWSDFGAGVIKRAFLNGSDVQVIKKKVEGKCFLSKLRVKGFCQTIHWNGAWRVIYGWNDFPLGSKVWYSVQWIIGIPCVTPPMCWCIGTASLYTYPWKLYHMVMCYTT